MLFYACQKGISGLTQQTPLLTASSTNVAVGQVVSLSVVNAPLGTHNDWSSSPQANSIFAAASAHDAVNVSFTKPGTYVVTCYFASGVGSDSLPVYDTTTLPHDTTVYYPPAPPPTTPDSTSYPHDTITNPHDTIPSYTPPQDSTYNPGDTTHYPVDTTHNPTDTVRNPVDSTHSTTGHTGTNSVSIVIVVH